MDIFESLPLEGIYDVRILCGGDVNDAYKVYARGGEYFCLVQKNARKNFYQAEVMGLKLFEKNNIKAPRVISCGLVGRDAYLLLDFLEEGFVGDFRDLGRLIADLHRIESPNGQFGFDYAYHGSRIIFSNTYKDTWKEVFLEERMDKLSALLLETSLWDESRYKTYEKVRKIIEEALDKHTSRPSLLHGDLWSGNFMFLKDGQPAIFDPSPFYGDREFDLGISMVFSGFDKSFYQAYNKYYPLDEGFALRLEFYKLYFLMVHLHKFGSSYKTSVDRAMDKIISFKG
ncbi:fructosamine kinase family protein [uncultured Anaerococcus sp.]|uniref:fructosamine kinase family protein n=1 Tax=uncultured Anaerococcus sp. TaxID=293428 RepID=UPI002633691E|nr:fructosamine kinase family protein [uncultured Anaerococcus sp.]